jgi:pantothenate kinase
VSGAAAGRGGVAAPSGHVAVEAVPTETRRAPLIRRVRALADGGARTLLGVTGPPGAGKSTLAREIVEWTDGAARVVAMDGFHLSTSRLARLGRLDRMGAIDTFDAAGFVALLRRLREPSAGTVYAPEFRRTIEEPIAGAVAIERDVRLVVVEGNYLLAEQKPWDEVRTLLDEAWYCEPDEESRLANLIARHRSYGKTPEEARRWALGSDQRNAALIAATRSRADLIVTLEAAPSSG